MQISGPDFSENGSFQSTDELLRNGVSAQTSFMFSIISKTLQRSSEQDSALRTSALNELGKGLRVNTEA